MRCTNCEGKTKVVDCREIRGGAAFYRRRECKDCKARVTTFELVVRERPPRCQPAGKLDPITRAELLAAIADI